MRRDADERADGVDEGDGHDEGDDWPYASILILGYFGSDSRAGKRLVLEASAALLLLVISAAALAGGFPGPGHPIQWLFAAALPLSVASIVWSYARYMSSLDELGRTMQLKAFAFSYGVVMTLAAAMVGLAMVTSGGSGGEYPASYLWFLVAAEPVRAYALFVLARKYR